jgi:hypothetical protein
VGDGRKLEGDGQMVWSDTSKKTGGLRFLNPSQELREQVREWLEETLVTADGKLDPGALESKAKRQRNKRREEARAEAELAWEEGTLKAESKAAAGIEPGIARTGAGETADTKIESAAANRTFHVEASDDFAFRGPGFALTTTGIWRGVSAIALSAILSMAVIGYRRELGHLVMSFGSSIAGDEQKGGGGAAPDAHGVADDITSRDHAAANASPEVGSPAEPVATPGEPEAMNEGGAEATPVRDEQVIPSSAVIPSGAARRVSSPQEGAGEDVTSLWTAVENGDTHAEVALAGRYVRGEGVPQSCAQARVLLEAAVKRGSAEARQKLDELPQAGCP